MACATLAGQLSFGSLPVTSILDVLERSLHAQKSEWIFLRELRVGTGRRNGSLQRLDAFALNTLPHQAMKRVCYEIKTSRADLLCELRQPLKRRIGMRYSNEFYFVTSPGVARCEDLPAECGLIEVGRTAPDLFRQRLPADCSFFWYDPADRSYCIRIAPAAWRDTPGPTWQLVAAMIRNGQREARQDATPARPQQGRLEFA